MKQLIFVLAFLPLFSNAQIGYSVNVTKLMATADDCDGGSPLCLSAPQDPVFNIWVTDAEGNEQTNCFVFDGDAAMGFGLWNDIPDFELSNQSYVNTNYISFDMGAFESDALSGIPCTSGSLDDNIYDRAFNKLITTASMPMNVVYTDTLEVGGMYYMVVDILWYDYASLNEISNELAVAISPNPSNGVFKINLTEANVNKFDLMVYDVSGNEIYTNSIDAKEAMLDLTNQKAGIYFVEIVTDNRSITKRIQLQN